MPKYLIELTDGRKFEVEADSQPSEVDVLSALGGTQAQPETPQTTQEPQAPARGMLPTAGSFVGSLVGTLGGVSGRIAGAGVGGALGKGAELLMDEKDDSVLDSLKAMGVEGGKQAAYETAGGVVGKGLRALAPKLATLALSPVKSVAQKYQNIGSTYVREGKMFSGLRGGVGAVGKAKSAEQAKGLRKLSRKASDAYTAFADSDAGTPQIAGRKVISELRPLMDEAADLAQTGKPDVRPAIAARAKAFARNNKAMTATQGTRLRRTLDTAADKAFAAEQKMGTPAPLEARVDKALAQGLRRVVREAAPKAQPDTTRTMELVGLEKALRDASLRPHNLTRNMALTAGAMGVGGGVLAGDPQAGLGSGIGTLGAAYALTNPRNLGRMALASHGAGRLAELTPELIRAALLARLLSGSEAQPPLQEGQ